MLVYGNGCFWYMIRKMAWAEGRRFENERKMTGLINSINH